jgi:hypothetical protein
MNSPRKTVSSEEVRASIKKLPWQIKLLALTLLIPVEASFYVGDFRLTFYRLLLLLAIFFCFRLVFSNKAGGVLITDKLLVGYSLWLLLSLYINHNFMVMLQSGGVLVLESFGAYLLARAYVRNEQDFRNFVKLFFLIVVGLSFFTIPESLTGYNFFKPGAGHIDPRFGLERAYGPFEHAILYGVFCASIFSLCLYVVTKSFNERTWAKAGWVAAASFVSVSAGALAAVMVQLILHIWERITRRWVFRWRIFTFLLLVAYVVIDLLSNRTPIVVLLHRLTFSAETAYNRLLIWEFGTKLNVAEHPWFGIGFADWVRPSWMHSGSMDNFWLVIMVRHGLPTFTLLATGIICLLFLVGRNNLPEKLKPLRLGWLFSITGMIIAGSTVHFWNTLHVWFFFLLGSGAWLATVKSDQPPPGNPRTLAYRSKNNRP